MATTADFRNGLCIVFKDDLYRIVQFQHVKPGKGPAFVRTKMQNIKTGRTLENTFTSGVKIDVVRIERRPYQFLYMEGEDYIMMHTETFEQIPLNHEKVEDAIKFLKENMFAIIKFYKGEAFSVEAPNFVELLITQCDPSVKGNTATNAMKPATLETGAQVNVPMFVNEGDTIRVDTRTGEYMERV